MRNAVVAAAACVLGLAAAPARACPEHASYAFAVVADGDTPGLAAAIDRIGFGGWGGGIGLVVTGNTIAEPLGPLVTISGDRLSGQPATGDAEYAAELAMLTADHAGYTMHAMYVIGELSPEARDRLHARARAHHVHLLEYATADEVAQPRPRATARPTSESQVVVPDPRRPAPVSSWLALLLLGAAAYLSRRALTV